MCCCVHSIAFCLQCSLPIAAREATLLLVSIARLSYAYSDQCVRLCQWSSSHHNLNKMMDSHSASAAQRSDAVDLQPPSASANNILGAGCVNESMVQSFFSALRRMAGKFAINQTLAMRWWRNYDEYISSLSLMPNSSRTPLRASTYCLYWFSFSTFCLIPSKMRTAVE